MGNASDILIAGLGGAASGFFHGQIKENDEAKVQAETERREKLLLEKEKRAAQAEEYKALRERGWKVDDAKTKRSEELADADTKQVFELTKDASKNDFEMRKQEAQNTFLSGQTDKNNAARLKAAETLATSRENVADKKGGLSETTKTRLEEKLAKYDDEGVDDSNINQVSAIRKRLGLPPLQKVVKKKGEKKTFGKDIAEEYEYVESFGDEELDPFDVISNNIKFKKDGPNDVVIQPKPLGNKQ